MAAYFINLRFMLFVLMVSAYKLLILPIMKLLLSFLLIGLCFSCTTKTNKPMLYISLDSSKQTLKITGLSNVIVQDINRDTTTNKWQQLIPVYRMPIDTDMKDFQPIQPGKYWVKDSVIFFRPDTPFVQQQTYFVRHYHYDEERSVWGFIKGERRAGKTNYTDLIFKQ
jgi:hypothetical protein